MLLKVGTVGDRVRDFTAEEGESAGNILRRAGLTPGERDQIQVNGSPANLNTRVYAPNPNDPNSVAVVLISPQVKGAQFVIKVVFSGGRSQDAAVNEGASVAAAVSAAGFGAIPDGATIQVDGRTATRDTVLHGNEKLVMISPQVKGAL